MTPFTIARLPRIEFGAGALGKLPALARTYGMRVLLVTGSHSFTDSVHWPTLQAGLATQGIHWEHLAVSGEPSPETVDEAVRRFHGQGIAAVVAIGGGSALDAGKAIAGLLPQGHSVMDYLEGVGPERVYSGPGTPFIAVPTTAGTGSEASKNAVLSRQGADGFKKSFRDEQLVAEWAIVDPDLYATCPRELIAANGMDAFTQLLESFVSTRANAYTDALARDGLACVRDGLLAWHADTNDGAARARMAYAALLSGITLAQCGLGSVHGLASPLGAYFPIPHGVVCGTLVAAATEVNLKALLERVPGNPALGKYAEVGAILTGKHYKNWENGWDALVKTLKDWTTRLALPRLSGYGVTVNDLARIVAGSRGSSMRTNPVALTDEEIAAVIEARL